MAKRASRSKSKKATMALLYIIIVLLIALIGFCIWNIYTSFNEYTVGEETYLGMIGSYLTNVPNADSTAGTQTDASQANGTNVTQDGLIANVTPLDQAGSAAGSTSGIVTQKPEVNFTALKSDNADAMGWIYSPNTVISYPVVHGSDNEYYLTHLFDGTTNKLGTIFVDCRNGSNLSDQNTLIYGHNMKNGSMFASLHNYSSQAYYNQHPYYYLYTENATYRVDIFSAYLTTTADACFCTDYGSEETFSLFLSGAKANSAITTSVDVSAQDRIVTLVTCHSSSDDARYVVMGKLVAE
jgi:sortase B